MVEKPRAWFVLAAAITLVVAASATRTLPGRITTANSYALKALKPNIAKQIEEIRKKSIVEYGDPLSDVLLKNGETCCRHTLAEIFDISRQGSERHWQG